MTNSESKHLKQLLKNYLKLMEQGNYQDARGIAQSLESATYVLDPVWVEAYNKRIA
jgi:hypothetical protein